MGKDQLNIYRDQSVIVIMGARSGGKTAILPPLEIATKN